MEIFYFTFGYGHPHPGTGEQMTGYWIEVEAPSYGKAQEVMVNSIYGIKWAFQYTKEKFRPEYFALGCYERMKYQEDKNTCQERTHTKINE